MLLAGLLVVSSASLRGQATERSIFVSVVDKGGAPVADLGPKDFVVREDQVTREVLRVAPATEPLQIALLVDNSQFAEPYTRDYREALPAFASGIFSAGSGNQISLITLASRPTILSDYTSNAAQLQKGVERIFAESNSGTYLLDALIEVSRGIMKRASTRPVIVAITGEGRELSERYHEQVLTPLRASGAAFHAIVLGRPMNSQQDRAVVLSRGTAETGGQYETLLASSALKGFLEKLARELTQQYRVTYARPRSLIPPERVAVSTTRQGLTARGTAQIEPPAAPPSRR
jgi:VWFA-related protein